MKIKFKFFGLLVTICLIICCVFAGCLSSPDYEEIYNDDTKIARSSSNKRIGSVETSSDENYKFSCSSLSGVYVMINSFTVNENTSANLTLEVTGGKCKVVLVKGDSVYTVCEGSYDGAVNLGYPDGKYKLKIVGVEAEFTLSLTY